MNSGGNSVERKTMSGRKLSKSTVRALERNSLLIERAVLLGHLQVLENQLQGFLFLQNTAGGRVYVNWWHENFRRDIIARIVELNQLLGFNFPVQYTRL